MRKQLLIIGLVLCLVVTSGQLFSDDTTGAEDIRMPREHLHSGARLGEEIMSEVEHPKTMGVQRPLKKGGLLNALGRLIGLGGGADDESQGAIKDLEEMVRSENWSGIQEKLQELLKKGKRTAQKEGKVWDLDTWRKFAEKEGFDWESWQKTLSKKYKDFDYSKVKDIIQDKGLESVDALKDKLKGLNINFEDLQESFEDKVEDLSQWREWLQDKAFDWKKYFGKQFKDLDFDKVKEILEDKTNVDFDAIQEKLEKLGGIKLDQVRDFIEENVSDKLNFDKLREKLSDKGFDWDWLKEQVEEKYKDAKKFDFGKFKDLLLNKDVTSWGSLQDAIDEAGWKLEDLQDWFYQSISMLDVNDWARRLSHKGFNWDRMEKAWTKKFGKNKGFAFDKIRDTLKGGKDQSERTVRDIQKELEKYGVKLEDLWGDLKDYIKDSDVFDFDAWKEKLTSKDFDWESLKKEMIAKYKDVKNFDWDKIKKVLEDKDIPDLEDLKHHLKDYGVDFADWEEYFDDAKDKLSSFLKDKDWEGLEDFVTSKLSKNKLLKRECLYNQFKEKAQELYDNTKEGTTEAKNRAQEKLHEAQNRIGETAEKIKHRTEEKLEQAGDFAAETAHKTLNVVNEKTGGMFDFITDRYLSLTGYLKRKMGLSRSKVDDLEDLIKNKKWDQLSDKAKALWEEKKDWLERLDWDELKERVGLDADFDWTDLKEKVEGLDIDEFKKLLGDKVDFDKIKETIGAERWEQTLKYFKEKFGFSFDDLKEKLLGEKFDWEDLKDKLADKLKDKKIDIEEWKKYLGNKDIDLGKWNEWIKEKSGLDVQDVVDYFHDSEIDFDVIKDNLGAKNFDWERLRFEFNDKLGKHVDLSGLKDLFKDPSKVSLRKLKSWLSEWGISSHDMERYLRKTERRAGLDSLRDLDWDDFKSWGKDKIENFTDINVEKAQSYLKDKTNLGWNDIKDKFAQWNLKTDDIKSYLKEKKDEFSDFSMEDMFKMWKDEHFDWKGFRESVGDKFEGLDDKWEDFKDKVSAEIPDEDDFNKWAKKYKVDVNDVRHYLRDKRDEAKDFIHTEDWEGLKRYAERRLKAGKQFVKATGEKLLEKGEELKDDIVGKGEELKDKVEDKAGDVKDSVKDSLKDAKKGARRLVDDAEDTVEDLKSKGDSLKDRLADKWDDLKDAVEDKLADAKSAGRRIKDKVADKLEDVKDGAEDLKDDAEDKLDDLKDDLSSTGRRIKNRVGDKLDDLKDGAEDLKENLEDNFDDLKDAASDIASKINRKFKDLKASAEDKLEDAKDFVGDKAEDVKDFASEKAAQTKKLAREARAKTSEATEDLKDRAADLTGNLGDHADHLHATLNDKLDSLKDFFRDTFSSKKARQVKDRVQDGIEDLKDSAENLKDRVADKAEDVKDAVSDKVGQAKGYGQEVLDKINSRLDDLQGQLKDLRSSGKGVKEEVREKLTKNIQEVRENVTETVEDKGNEVFDHLHEKLDDIRGFFGSILTKKETTSDDVERELNEQDSETAAPHEAAIHKVSTPAEILKECETCELPDHHDSVMEKVNERIESVKLFLSERFSRVKSESLDDARRTEDEKSRVGGRTDPDHRDTEESFIKRKYEEVKRKLDQLMNENH